MYDDCLPDIDPDEALLLERAYRCHAGGTPHVADTTANEGAHRSMDAFAF